MTHIKCHSHSYAQRNKIEVRVIKSSGSGKKEFKNFVVARAKALIL